MSKVVFSAFFEISLLVTLEPHVGHTNFRDFYNLSQIIIHTCGKVVSTPSLPGTQQQLQQQHLRLHQQECGSAAAAPTARMRRMQQPMLHVSSCISRESVVSVSILCVLRVCYYTCGSVCWNPIFQFFFLLCLLLLLLKVTDTALRLSTTAVHAGS